MNRAIQTTVLPATLLLFACSAMAQQMRNPFGVADVPDPFNDRVISFAEGIQLSGGQVDVNAEQWTDEPLQGNPMILEGDWFGRWNNMGTDAWQDGRAKIAERGDRVFILFEGIGGDRYLIEARRERHGKLIGGYVSVGTDGVASPWVGLLVDGERIDGIWSDNGGRWDFRRQAVRKLPESVDSSKSIP